MQHLSLTLDSIAENLALDEALLDAHESGEMTGGVLRLWEAPGYAVVLGRSSNAEQEIQLANCRQNKVPVLRRCSGGGPIVAGPGCLMYAIVLDFESHPNLREISQAHNFVLGQIVEGLSQLNSHVAAAGTSDLILQPSAIQEMPLKFSGNALRIKRNHLLYHGTLLYDFDLSLVSELLDTATRQPEYRQCRSHDQFITNFPASREQLSQSLVRTWQAKQSLEMWPTTRVAQLIDEKYNTNSKWTILSI